MYIDLHTPFVLLLRAIKVESLNAVVLCAFRDCIIIVGFHKCVFVCVNSDMNHIWEKICW